MLPDLNDTALVWLAPMRKSCFIIYYLVIALFLSGFISLFFVRVYISVRAPGIIRPLNERTDIKSAVTGIIDSIYFREGDRVETNNLLMTVRDPALTGKKRFIEAEIGTRRDFIHDLDLLINNGGMSVKLIPQLIHPMYRQEARRFFTHAEELQINLSKARHESSLNEILARDKVISPKEFYDIRIQEQKAVSGIEVFRRQQLSEWQSDLTKYKMELKEFIFRQEEIGRLYETYHIRVPIGGWLQELNTHYPGGSVQTGEMICSVSPGGLLLGECYVATKDIGMLRPGLPARFQIDAFDYNYFGVVTGSIISIDNDFILIDKTPAYRVRCRMDQKKLVLSKGFHGDLKKGMRFQARFITGKRSLWQLLYDTIDDWLNPTRTRF
jgi:multidrug resistance efflux pump